MSNQEEHIVNPEREKGFTEFKAALENVVVSSPEVLNEFADTLEAELYTLDTADSKSLVRNLIEVMRATAKTVEQ
ncbi:MAG: hypothetical protein A2942_01580 [Candidatus Lloydbacteria bacterium RIFCSPLOWO2_01_FULL_50_20]|uniref:Uncharacterized protein n=1 Tax=Candidatus Lloydbacteria bacterium RIFCSPLOWO2_01_FULL_50_20 TaxID=1798665 RepID=A0A1G2DGQ8_9BACT|nr:MAG: hypothetical protein A3C13_00955 [Candidatus Lloydbacteria bacterium RIFCSPHIGHO2_02_FULL_50_11]OGZ12864.1 MAG: hypothetical protein A2942_01580 [Candidatus Lloydbacteria bacterium RIFCSPLOWO2_01_FULL_50_20]